MSPRTKPFRSNADPVDLNHEAVRMGAHSPSDRRAGESPFPEPPARRTPSLLDDLDDPDDSLTADPPADPPLVDPPPSDSPSDPITDLAALGDWDDLDQVKPAYFEDLPLPLHHAYVEPPPKPPRELAPVTHPRDLPPTGPVDPDGLAESLGPLAPPPGMPLPSEEDLALRRAIWRNLRDLNVDDGGMDLTGLSDITPAQLEETDHARLARLAYGMGYVRLLEFLARKPPHWAGNTEQAKLAFAYVKHVETNDRDTLKLARRTQSDEHLDRALVQMQREVLRLAVVREKITKRVDVDGQEG